MNHCNLILNKLLVLCRYCKDLACLNTTVQNRPQLLPFTRIETLHGGQTLKNLVPPWIIIG